MRVLVSGASGLIGTALRRHLTSEGHDVRRLVRREASAADEVSWDPAAGTIDGTALDGVDAVVNLAGEGIGDHRWTDEHKRRVLDSRLQSTSVLAEAIAAAADPPKVFASGSAVGWYGDTGDTAVDENSPAGTGFLADVCRRWEEAAEPAKEAGTRLVLLRTGIVLSPEGGALAKQLPFFRLGIGGPLGSGKQWTSWISIDDEVRAIAFALEHEDVRGPVNLTAPAPVTNKEFSRALGRALHRPSLLPVPPPALALLFGKQMTDEMLMVSQRALPRRLEQHGFVFQDPDVEGALTRLLGKDRGA